jgi:hypothetical protein
MGKREHESNKERRGRERKKERKKERKRDYSGLSVCIISI